MVTLRYGTFSVAALIVLMLHISRSPKAILASPYSMLIACFEVDAGEGWSEELEFGPFIEVC
jgi:hypothetical protein